MPDQKTMENYLSNEPYFGTIGENDQNEFWRAGSWIGPIVQWRDLDTRWPERGNLLSGETVHSTYVLLFWFTSPVSGTCSVDD